MLWSWLPRRRCLWRKKPCPTNSATLLKEQSGDSDSAPTHVRSYFPEALYINPEIITDQDGRASIVIPLADSITTWRMAMLASTTHGGTRQRHFQS